FSRFSTYRGIPIITYRYVLTEEFQDERNTFEESVDCIEDELDKAAELLHLVQNGKNEGRATKEPTMALKSRVLLYAASDLYNTDIFPSYEKPELIRYMDNNRMERWRKAKDAAKAVIELDQYELYKEDPAPTENITQNLTEIFIQKKTIED